METDIQISYDGTFEGFLTSVAIALDKQLNVQGFNKGTQVQNGLFRDSRVIHTDRSRAMRLWDSLGRKSLGLHRIVYFSYLSEKPDIELYIFNYLKCLFTDAEEGCPSRKESRMRLNRWAGKVEAEKSALESKMHFNTTRDGIPFCSIAPEFNVLPLLSRYFRMQFGSGAWLISDRRRGYSLYSHNGGIEMLRNGSLPVLGADGVAREKSAYRQAV